MLWLFKINFCGFRRFLIHGNSSYVVLYTQCLRYNICSAWFLDIRISTCCSFCSFSLNHQYFPVNHGLVNQQYKSTECYSETFNTKSYFPLKMQKFSPMDVFLYTVLYQYGCHSVDTSNTCKT